jgi:hypothetical protein
MSKLKNPRAKKAASLSRDRRNADGENSKAARKNIPRAKARTHREQRRAVHQAIAAPAELVSETGLVHAENLVTKATRDAKAHGFRKKPDVPLGEVLADKRERRRRS